MQFIANDAKQVFFCKCFIESRQGWILIKARMDPHQGKDVESRQGCWIKVRMAPHFDLTWTFTLCHWLPLCGCSLSTTLPVSLSIPRRMQPERPLGIGFSLPIEWFHATYHLLPKPSSESLPETTRNSIAVSIFAVAIYETQWPWTPGEVKAAFPR